MCKDADAILTVIGDEIPEYETPVETIYATKINGKWVRLNFDEETEKRRDEWAASLIN